MKYLAIIMPVLIIVSAFPSVVFADNWEEYLALRNQYYYLDKQKFNNITCTVESTTLTDAIRQLKTQFEPLKDNIEIVENLSSFSLNYSNSTGLDINRPELDIVIKSEEGMTDPVKVRNGVYMIKSGFKQAITGIVMQLEGILEGYVSPSKEDFGMLELTNTKEGSIVTYKRGGNDVTETFSDNKLETKSVGMGGEMHASESYEETEDKKLILRDAKITVNQQMGKIESDVSMTYQKVGSVIFPKRIVTKFAQELQSMRQEGQTEINLNDCEAN